MRTHAPRDQEASYRHGLRVRMGHIDGARGVLLRCESRRPGGRPYWRVRLQTTGEWIWPDAQGGIIVDGQGDTVNPQCASCELPFVMPAGSGEVLCARCNDEQFGPTSRVSEPPPAKRWNSRRRWIGRRSR